MQSVLLHTDEGYQLVAGQHYCENEVPGRERKIEIIFFLVGKYTSTTKQLGGKECLKTRYSRLENLY